MPGGEPLCRTQVEAGSLSHVRMHVRHVMKFSVLRNFFFCAHVSGYSNAELFELSKLKFIAVRTDVVPGVKQVDVQ